MEIQGLADTLSSNSDGSIHLKDYAFEPFYDSDDYGNVNSFVLTIDTEHPEAWESYLNETLTGEGLEKNKDYTLDLIGKDHLYFAFPEGESINRLTRLYVGKTVVNAELGIGLS